MIQVNLLRKVVEILGEMLFKVLKNLKYGDSLCFWTLKAYYTTCLSSVYFQING